MSGESSAVFLLSTERSGSNLVRTILNTHSGIVGPHPLETAYPWRKTKPAGELSPAKRRRLIRDILISKQYSFHPLVEALDIDAVVDRLESTDLDSFLAVQQALYEEYAATVGTSHWVSKDPSMWDYLDEAFEHYEDLKIVYLVRDPRDVVLSFKNSNVGQYHPYFNAKRWQEEQEAGLNLLKERPDTIHRIRYEDLLQNPEEEAQALCSFLDLEYEPEMLYYYESEDARESSKSADVFENLSVPIKSDNYGKYLDRLPYEEIKITEHIAADEMEQHGYDLEHDRELLNEFEPDEAAYTERNRDLKRAATLKYWRESPREQIDRYATRSFSYYMILKYGLLA